MNIEVLILTLTWAVRLSDVHLVPVTIDYEKALEVSLHPSELLGGGKVRIGVGLGRHHAQLVS